MRYRIESGVDRAVHRVLRTAAGRLGGVEKWNYRVVRKHVNVFVRLVK